MKPNLEQAATRQGQKRDDVEDEDECVDQRRPAQAQRGEHEGPRRPVAEAREVGAGHETAGPIADRLTCRREIGDDIAARERPLSVAEANPEQAQRERVPPAERAIRIRRRLGAASVTSRGELPADLLGVQGRGREPHALTAGCPVGDGAARSATS